MKIPLLIPLLLLALLAAPMTGSAQPRGQVVAIDNSVFVAMVDPSIEDCIYIQEKENWCWAACVQMIVVHYGIWTTQSEVVEEVFGSPLDLTASGTEITTALDGCMGLTFNKIRTKSADRVVEALSRGHPLIAGLEEHAYVVTQLFMTRYGQGFRPLKVALINPATAGEEILDWPTFHRRLNTLLEISLK